ncbi:MAG: Ig-like domain-containing protein [Micrococcales bacterium]|nr:Ig-like domain-containing protein [Micrococcales bacterium]
MGLQNLAARFVEPPPSVEGLDFSVWVTPGSLSTGNDAATVRVKAQDHIFKIPAGGLAAKLKAFGPAGTESYLSVSEFVETEPGVYEAAVTSTVVGNYRVEVYFSYTGPVTSRDDGFRLTELEAPDLNDVAHFVACCSPPQVASAVLTVSSGQVLSDGVSVHTATVTVTDENGMGVPDVAVSFAVSVMSQIVGSEATPPNSLTVETSALGVARIEITSPWAGLAYVTASLPPGIGAVTVENSPAQIDFTDLHGLLTTARYTLRVSPDAARDDGRDTVTITVTAHDAAGKPLTGIADRLTVLLLTDNGALPTVSRFAETATLGVYVATVTSLSPGAFRIMAFVELGEPGTPGGNRRQVTELALPNPNDVANFYRPHGDWWPTWWIEPCNPITASHPAVLADGVDCYVVKADLDHPRVLEPERPRLDNTGTRAITSTPAGATFGTPVETSPGHWSIKVTATTAADYLVGYSNSDYWLTSISLEAKFEPSIPAALELSLAAPVEASLVHLEPQVIRATVSTDETPPVLTGGVDVAFTVPAGTSATGCTEAESVDGGPGATCTVTTGTSVDLLGVAEMSLWSADPGSYPVTAQIAGESSTATSVYASFYELIIPAATEWFEVSGTPASADGVQTVTITAHWIDLVGSPVTGKAANLRAFGSAGTGSNLDISEFTETSPGVYVATVASRVVGDYRIEVWANLDSAWPDEGWKIENLPGPDMARFTACCNEPLDLASAVLAVSSGVVVNDAIGRHTATVTLTDSLGGPVPGVEVSFSVDGAARIVGSTATPPNTMTVQTSPQGTARIEITDLTAEVVNVTAALPPGIGAITVENSPAQVEFAASSSMPQAVATASLGTTPSDGVAAHTAVVWVKDAAGAPLPDVTVRFTASGSARIAGAQGASPNQLEVATSAIGAATVQVTDATAETVNLSITLPGFPEVTVSGAPLTLVFASIESGPSLAESTIETNRGYVEANLANTLGRGAVDQARLTVTLFGPLGNRLNLPDAEVRVSTAKTGVVVSDAGLAALNADGSFGVSVSSSSPGDAVFGFTVNGTAASGTVTVRFVSTPAAPTFATAVAGPRAVSGRAEPNHQIQVVSGATGESVCITFANASGDWTCEFATALAHGTELLARSQNLQYLDPAVHTTPVAVANHTFSSAPAAVKVKATTPLLKLLPTDGKVFKGQAESGGTVTISNASGTILCSVTVGTGGSWSCNLAAALSEGGIVTIKFTDPVGNSTTTSWRVGLPKAVAAVIKLVVGAKQTVTVKNLQPGESASAVMNSKPVALGSQTADANGEATWTFAIPAGTDPGTHKFVLTGALSGTTEAQFQVVAQASTGPPGSGPGNDPAPGSGSAAGAGSTSNGLPFTGSNVGIPAAIAAVLVALGILLIAARRRRDRQDND